MNNVSFLELKPAGSGAFASRLVGVLWRGRVLKFPKSPHATFDDVAKTLTTYGLSTLARWRSTEIEPYIEDLSIMPQLQQSSIMISGNKAGEGLWMLVGRGYGKKVLSIIENLPEEAQVMVLSKDRVIWSLCLENAPAVVRLIEKMNEPNQKRLFDVRGAVPALIAHNQEEAVNRIMGSWKNRSVIDFAMPPALTAG